MSSESYLIAWLWYLSASCALLLVAWRVSRTWPLLVKYPLRALLAVLLLVPVSVTPELDSLAPAWLVLLFDAFLQDGASPLRAARPMLVFAVVALLTVVLAWWLQRRRDAAAGGAPAEASDA